jgi:hypothetical protein
MPDLRRKPPAKVGKIAERSASACTIRLGDFAHAETRDRAFAALLNEVAGERQYPKRPTYCAATARPIALFTRGITSVAMSSIDRLARAGSSQSIPA